MKCLQTKLAINLIQLEKFRRPNKPDGDLRQDFPIPVYMGKQTLIKLTKVLDSPHVPQI